jgi:hypothetical protein
MIIMSIKGRFYLFFAAISDNAKEINKRLSLGQGIAASPSLHVGQDKGDNAFVQSSTGEVLVIEQENLPEGYRNRPLHWIPVVD